MCGYCDEDREEAMQSLEARLSGVVHIADGAASSSAPPSAGSNFSGAYVAIAVATISAYATKVANAYVV